jgi:hypothetical protein
VSGHRLPSYSIIVFVLRREQFIAVLLIYLLGEH